MQANPLPPPIPPVFFFFFIIFKEQVSCTKAAIGIRKVPFWSKEKKRAKYKYNRIGLNLREESAQTNEIDVL